jgi:hypothetical protein
LPLDPHMSGDMLTWYLKEHLLEAKQTLANVSNLLKKLVTKHKIEPLGSQKVGPKNGQQGVTRLEYFIVLPRMGKC